MNDNYISKLETDNFYIGSFDAYFDLSKALIMKNTDVSEEEADDILKSMPTTSRAAIVDKSGKYIGYIGLFDVDQKNGVASIRFEVNKDLSFEDRVEILTEYIKYIDETLNINDTKEFMYISDESTEYEKNDVFTENNIIISSKFLEPGVSAETLERYSQDYSIPRLQMPFTIKSGGRVIGIIGLSNVLWANKRANLNIFLDKELGSDIINELSGDIIDEYINFVHSSNIHNLTFSVNGSNEDMLKIIDSTSMNYYGTIPYSMLNNDRLDSNFMFQHIPYMKKQNGIYIPENEFVLLDRLNRDKKELSEIIDLGDGFKMVSPKHFEEANIDMNKIIKSHTKAMQNREGFAVPLGEDKYFLQRGNGNYGISKAVANYTYIILDEYNNYAGYINILRSNANGKNVEVEIGIDPKLQNRGLGTKVLTKFYDELFLIGVASVISTVFEFNNPSIRLHEKVAELNGTRIESYYINGKLWDMNLYSRVNDDINEHKRHQ